MVVQDNPAGSVKTSGFGGVCKDRGAEGLEAYSSGEKKVRDYGGVDMKKSRMFP